MTTSRKAVISLLIAIILFGVFSILAFSGLFGLLETRFYDPSVTARLNRDITQNAEAIDTFFTETQKRFSETLKADTVRRSFLSNQRTDDASARSSIYYQLRESFYGIQWVRFIDAGGKRILFSSYAPDVLNSGDTFPVYADYNEPNLPYELIAVPEDGAPKYTFDEAGRVIFSFPLYDSFDIYRGTALFSLSIDAVTTRLVNEGRIKYGENITVISNPEGLLFGPVQASDHQLVPEGNTGSAGPQRKVLISTRSSGGVFVGRLVNEEVFMLPAIMKIILLLAFFLTTYLIIFLLFNLQQDPLVVVQNRLKQLQISLIEQFYESKGEADWARWIRELEHRREEVRSLLKRGVKTDSTKSADMDILIDKSWDELLAMLGSRRNLAVQSNLPASGEAGIDEEKIAAVLQKLLEAARAAAPSSVKTTGGKTGLLKKAAPIAEMGKTESVEEIEVLEELDEAEDLKTAASDIDNIAKKIEFNPDIEPETADDKLFNEGLEIVSPFSAMVFDSVPEQSSGTDDAGGAEDGANEDQSKENRDGELGINGDTDAAKGLPIITTPFSDFSSDEEIETLEALSDEKEEQINGDDSVIKEREGVHYISEDVLTPSPEVSATLNPGFKELVDDVTK